MTKSKYRFCGICGGSHDPDKLCGDVANRMGLPAKPGVSPNFKNLARKADATLLMLLVIFLAAFALLALITVLLR